MSTSFRHVSEELDYLYVERGVSVPVLSKVFEIDKSLLSWNLSRRSAKKRRVQFEWGLAMRLSAEAVKIGLLPKAFHLQPYAHVGRLEEAFGEFVDDLYCIYGIRLVIIRSSFNLARSYVSGRVNKYRLVELQELHQTYEALLMKATLIREGRKVDDMGVLGLDMKEVAEVVSKEAVRLTRKEEDDMNDLSGMPIEVKIGLGIHACQ